MNNPQISDAELNAYVDGQVTSSDAMRIQEAVKEDKELSRKLLELQELKTLVREAYRAVPNPMPLRPKLSIHRPGVSAKSVLAASLLILAGIGGGWLLQHFIGGAYHPGYLLSGSPKGIVIQVSENDPVKWELALNNAANVKKAFKNKPMDVEIVAYGPGLKMFHADSPVGGKLAQASLSGVRLLACGNTMSMTKTLPNELDRHVKIVPAGIVEIMNKQGRGYAYVRP